MKVVFKGTDVSTDSILEAMRKFDEQYPNPYDYDGWLGKANYKYAVRCGERYYPVKQILSLATDITSDSFSGGDQANTVFRDLGFEIVPKPAQLTV